MDCSVYNEAFANKISFYKMCACGIKITCRALLFIFKLRFLYTQFKFAMFNESIAFIFSVKICLAVKRNANNKFKCGRMGHGDEVLRFYKNCAI